MDTIILLISFLPSSIFCQVNCKFTEDHYVYDKDENQYASFCDSTNNAFFSPDACLKIGNLRYERLPGKLNGLAEIKEALDKEMKKNVNAEKINFLKCSLKNETNVFVKIFKEAVRAYHTGCYTESMAAQEKFDIQKIKVIAENCANKAEVLLDYGADYASAISLSNYIAEAVNSFKRACNNPKNNDDNMGYCKKWGEAFLSHSMLQNAKEAFHISCFDKGRTDSCQQYQDVENKLHGKTKENAPYHQ